MKIAELFESIQSRPHDVLKKQAIKKTAAYLLQRKIAEVKRTWDSYADDGGPGSAGIDTGEKIVRPVTYKDYVDEYVIPKYGALDGTARVFLDEMWPTFQVEWNKYKDSL